MKSGGNQKSTRPKFTWSRWLDEWRMAASGILLATRERRFRLVAILTFIIFGTLMHLLSGSTAALSLLWSADFAGKIKIIFDGFLANFGVGQSFLDWLMIFVITVLQSILLGLVVLVWQKHRQNSKLQKTTSNADNVQSAGIVAGLAVLGTGCPTCGTTLLMPVIGAVFSTGGYALAGIISGIITAIAFLVALLALKRIGREAYALILSERFMRKHTKSNIKPNQEEKHE